MQHLPQPLQQVPRRVVEEYVRKRVVDFCGDPAFAHRLGLPSERVRQACIDTLADLLGGDLDLADTEGMQLVFRHDCLCMGCNNAECQLCKQNPNRRCKDNFAGKYLAGDPLKAKCGASIRVEVIDNATGELARGPDLDNLCLEMCILDGKAYANLEETATEDLTDAEVDQCVLLFNTMNKELLVPGRNANHNAEHKVVAQLVRGQCILPDLTVTGSSEALLTGVKPPFRLLVRAVSATTGRRVTTIRHAVSEAFVVATPRVRTAVKAEIPHVDDHVSKLEAVGVQTQNKLQDIQAAAHMVGVYNLSVPYNCVTKVGQFKELVEMAERDRPLCETLKKVLKLNKGWELARDHALSAVTTDNNMRIWYADASMTTGLLFKCNLGTVDLDHPAALLEKKSGAGPDNVMEATPAAGLTGTARDKLRRLQRKATISWWRDNHPGWAIWPVDTQEFMRGLQAQVSGGVAAEQIIAPAPANFAGTSPPSGAPSFAAPLTTVVAAAPRADSSGSEPNPFLPPAPHQASLSAFPAAYAQGGSAPLQLQSQPVPFGQAAAAASGEPWVPSDTKREDASTRSGELTEQPSWIPGHLGNQAQQQPPSAGRRIPPPSPFGQPDLQRNSTGSEFSRGSGATPSHAGSGSQPASQGAVYGNFGSVQQQHQQQHQQHLQQRAAAQAAQMLAGQPVPQLSDLQMQSLQSLLLQHSQQGNGHGSAHDPLSLSGILDSGSLAAVLALGGQLNASEGLPSLAPFASAGFGAGDGRQDGGRGGAHMPSIPSALYSEMREQRLPAREMRRSGSSGLMNMDSMADLDAMDPEAMLQEAMPHPSSTAPGHGAGAAAGSSAPRQTQGLPGGGSAGARDAQLRGAALAEQERRNMEVYQHLQRQQQRAARAGHPHRWLDRSNTNKSEGLESLQSMEEALPGE